MRRYLTVRLVCTLWLSLNVPVVAAVRLNVYVPGSVPVIFWEPTTHELVSRANQRSPQSTRFRPPEAKVKMSSATAKASHTWNDRDETSTPVGRRGSVRGPT